MAHRVTTAVLDSHDPRLGRHVEHDSRSRSYRVPRRTGPLVSVRHERRIPVLDQGSLGSCVGNAMEGIAGTAPCYAGIPADLPARPSATDAGLDEEQAVELYAAATQLDSFPGSYPGQDTGTSGLAGAKAAKAAGLLAGYRHVFSLDDLLTALQTVPVALGSNWYDSMFEPDADGLVTIGGQASVAGGHEYAADGLDVDRQLVLCVNSWGPQWGLSGRFALGWATLERLLAEQGDGIVPVPLDQPAPIPDPEPEPAPQPAPTPFPEAVAVYPVQTDQDGLPIVVDVHDGDTFRLAIDLGLDTGTWPPIRLAGADAPELRDPDGLRARDFTRRALTDADAVTVAPIGRSFERVVAFVRVNGQDLAQLLIGAGLATPEDPHGLLRDGS